MMMNIGDRVEKIGYMRILTAFLKLIVRKKENGGQKNKMKKTLSMICLLAIFATVFLYGCSSNSEIGKWRGSVPLEKFAEDSEIVKTVNQVLTGGKELGVIVEFKEDGSFTYDFDTTELEQALSGSAAAAIFLFTGLNASGIIDSIIGSIVKNALNISGAVKSGTYKTEDGYLICVEDENLVFKVENGTLVQYKENGDTFMTFAKEK